MHWQSLYNIFFFELGAKTIENSFTDMFISSNNDIEEEEESE